MNRQLTSVGLWVRDMPASLAFYRRAGVAIPDGVDGDGHVEVTMDNGLVLFWDTVELATNYDPERRNLAGAPAT